MGKALYRKYRSRSLDEVVGQEHITDTLKNALKKGAVSHAYLFTGPRGVGKTSVARILAHEVNKLKYDDEKFNIDIIEIDAASNRRIDEIRELRDKVHIAPTSSKYKVYIIDEVHMLTREAFNALLKTLEEPPDHAIFILATTEAHKVPATIISRTQRYSFKPIINDLAVKHLAKIAKKEGINITEDALEILAEHGQGSFRDSISMLDQISGFGYDEITKDKAIELLGIPSDTLLNQLLINIAKNDSKELFDTIQNLREQGANPGAIAKYLISTLRKQFNSSDSILDQKTSINIMKNLLSITGSGGTYEGIEIALLDNLKVDGSSESVPKRKSKNLLQDTKPIKTDVPVDQAPTQKETIAVLPTDDIREALNMTDQDTPPERGDRQIWDSILSQLKGDHNTLYGIMRMANVTFEEGKVRIVFNFEFHKKQLLQPKNMAVLNKIIAKDFGKNYSVEVTVVKKTKTSSKNISKKVDNDVLESVSNIFGSAELLES